MISPPSVVAAEDRLDYIHIAAYVGKLGVVTEILSANSHLVRSQNIDGLTPAHVAAAAGHVDVLRTIIDKAPEVLWVVDNDGWNLAHIAACWGRVSVLKFLSERAPKLFDTAANDGKLPCDVSTGGSCHMFFSHSAQAREQGPWLRPLPTRRTDVDTLPSKPIETRNFSRDSSRCLFRDRRHFSASADSV